MDNRHILDMIAEELVEKSRITGLVFDTSILIPSYCDADLGQFSILDHKIIDLDQLKIPDASLSIVFHY